MKAYHDNNSIDKAHTHNLFSIECAIRSVLIATHHSQVSVYCSQTTFKTSASSDWPIFDLKRMLYFPYQTSMAKSYHSAVKEKWWYTNSYLTTMKWIIKMWSGKCMIQFHSVRCSKQCASECHLCFHTLPSCKPLWWLESYFWTQFNLYIQRCTLHTSGKWMHLRALSQWKENTQQRMTNLLLGHKKLDVKKICKGTFKYRCIKKNRTHNHLFLSWKIMGVVINIQNKYTDMSTNMILLLTVPISTSRTTYRWSSAEPE